MGQSIEKICLLLKGGDKLNPGFYLTVAKKNTSILSNSASSLQMVKNLKTKDMTGQALDFSTVVAAMLSPTLSVSVENLRVDSSKERKEPAETDLSHMKPISKEGALISAKRPVSLSQADSGMQKKSINLFTRQKLDTHSFSRQAFTKDRNTDEPVKSNLGQTSMLAQTVALQSVRSVQVERGTQGRVYESPLHYLPIAASRKELKMSSQETTNLPIKMTNVSRPAALNTFVTRFGKVLEQRTEQQILSNTKEGQHEVATSNLKINLKSLKSIHPSVPSEMSRAKMGGHHLLPNPSSSLETSAPVLTSPNLVLANPNASEAHEILNLHHPNVSTEFAKLIATRIAANGNQLSVKVHPEGMGDLVISVSRVSSGIQVHVQASQMQTMQWLNQQSPQLMNAIQNAGMNVSGLQITYGQGDLSQSQGENQRGTDQSKFQVSKLRATSDSGFSDNLELLQEEAVRDQSLSISLKV